MTQNQCLVDQRSSLIGIALLLAVLVVATTRVAAQAPKGDNAIFSGSGMTIVSSPAFIDASVFYTTDLCTAVNTALGLIPPGGVVDARGISSSGAITCASNPFSGVTTPSTVLLPSGVISISHTWILPDRTRIIGQGNNPINGTQIWVTSTFTDPVMIQFCTAQCYGVSAEYVYLFGLGKTVNGIVNQYGGTGSYVDHANFYHITGTGLVIGGNATDSGPYANLAMTAGSSTCATTTSCVHLGDSSVGSPASTRGIHGLTCTCEGSGAAGGTGQVAVAVNSSNNTLEDMHFEGYVDGIELGYQGNAQNNVILNVNGGETKNDNMTSVIHICSSTSTVCPTSNVVSDVTIQGAVTTISSSMRPQITYVIEDDLSGTNIPSLSSPNITSVGMYVLGDPMGSTTGRYSRFTNASVAPTWGVSSSAANTSVTCQSGSLLSNVFGGTGTTLFACKGGVWTHLTF